MDKSIAIFMEWYNITDRCYTLQLYYTVISYTLQLRCEQHLLGETAFSAVQQTIIIILSAPYFWLNFVEDSGKN